MIIQKLNFTSITNDQVHPEKELSDFFNTQSKKMALCFLGQITIFIPLQIQHANRILKMSRSQIFSCDIESCQEAIFLEPKIHGVLVPN